MVYNHIYTCVKYSCDPWGVLVTLRRVGTKLWLLKRLSGLSVCVDSLSLGDTGFPLGEGKHNGRERERHAKVS